MVFLQQLFSNSVLITALLGWLVAQVLKIVLIWDKKLDFKRIVASGGMPSSHASFVMALAAGIGFTQGFDSGQFAAGVRRAAGQQAAILNKIVDDFVNADYSHTNKKLKELLGHTPIEVIGGAILGIIIAIIRHA